MIDVKPKSIRDIPLPDNTLDTLEKICDFTGGCYIFAEHPGTGKSTACKFIVKEAIEKLGKSKVLYINCSSARGIDVIRNQIEPFIRALGKRLVILEEADGLTPDAQNALKEDITSTKNKVTWILTTNNYMKLIDPIRTRGPRIDFLPQKQKIRKLLTNICKERGIKLSDRDILKIIDNTYPNFREAINCIIVPGKQTNYTEIRNDLIKLYNKELTVKDFERKHSGLSFDSIITIINSMSEKDIDDFPYIVMFAWKTATYSNMLSKKALLYFINNVKDNNFCKDMIKEIV
jgi:DNA polymerase III delta prime subunit